MADFQIYNASEKAMNKAQKKTKSIYPFDRLEVGQCFLVVNDGKYTRTNVGSSISRWNAKNKDQLICSILHKDQGEHGMIEVFRAK